MAVVGQDCLFSTPNAVPKTSSSQHPTNTPPFSVPNTQSDFLTRGRLGVFCVQGEVFRPEVGTHLYWPYKAGPSSRSETRASVGQVCFSCKV
ncbi:hypothetical protein RRG08_001569 [Elysia crispata]|uniref:Uncharacterized protein n=1 Tax=Elysia crispata TaxID=231223 RepID=A0AAE1ALZ0_9GAST|nr:hypothetical protein RRG08_001569 [Elysia crispata]